MNCDHCNTETEKVTPVNLKTGTRGRPPRKFYCDPCLATQAVSYRIPGAKVVVSGEGTELTASRLNGFDAACLFLLDMLPDNLFEPLGDHWHFRCKGCGDCIKRTERTVHHSEHKLALA